MQLYGILVINLAEMFIVWICPLKLGTEAPPPTTIIRLSTCITEIPRKNRNFVEELKSQFSRK
jgi:hypothetical protein